MVLEYHAGCELGELVAKLEEARLQENAGEMMRIVDAMGSILHPVVDTRVD